MTFATDSETALVNVRYFGAKGDGLTDDTLAIQTAINACPKGGLVQIPEGKYLVRPLFLKSYQTIELCKDGYLLGHTDRYVYPILSARLKRAEGTVFELSSWEGFVCLLIQHQNLLLKGSR